MVPATRPGRNRRSGQVLPIVILVGVLGVALSAVSIVSLYLGKVGSSVESMARAEPISGYEGRPEKAIGTGEKPPQDYLVLVTDEDDVLLSAHVVHLSGSRQQLTMIGLPVDLLVPYGPGQPQRSLAEAYQVGDEAVVQEVELLLGVRTDHQVRLGLDGFSGVVDAIGGFGDGELAEHADDGRALLGYVADAPDGPQRVERVSEVVRGTLERLDVVQAVTNPRQFDRVLRALEECTLVDSDLTVAAFEETLMESSVRVDEIASITLETTVSDAGRRAVPNHLAKLRKALQKDDFEGLAEPMAASAGTPTPHR